MALPPPGARPRCDRCWSWSSECLGIGIVTLVDDLWMLWDKQKQTLHDKVASTIVVKK